jgi:hypothetical protein
MRVRPSNALGRQQFREILRFIGAGPRFVPRQLGERPGVRWRPTPELGPMHTEAHAPARLAPYLLLRQGYNTPDHFITCLFVQWR